MGEGVGEIFSMKKNKQSLFSQNKHKIRLSAIIIARNEEEKISDCLKSLAWADEVIVVDNSSVDSTYSIAKKEGVRVVKASEKYVLRYSKLRNLGLEKARGKWVLYVDADERVSPELRKEIQPILSGKCLLDSGVVAFALPRRNFIFGFEFKHVGLWPDYVIRLFLKEKLLRWEKDLHEEPVFEGKVGHLESPLIHIKHKNLTEMIDKTNGWSDIEAKLMFDAGHPPMNVPRFLTAMFREFWLRMIRQTAFMDGVVGVIYALYQVFSKFISYAKLWEIQVARRKS